MEKSDGVASEPGRTVDAGGGSGAPADVEWGHLFEGGQTAAWAVLRHLKLVEMWMLAAGIKA